MLLANDQLAEWVNSRSRRRLPQRPWIRTSSRRSRRSSSWPAAAGPTPSRACSTLRRPCRAAGYTPDLVVMSPADGLALQLLQLTGGDSYVFSQTPPRIVITPAVGDGDGFVADRDALGDALYLTPLRVQAFEENAGATNTSTVRCRERRPVHRPAARCCRVPGRVLVMVSHRPALTRASSPAPCGAACHNGAGRAWVVGRLNPPDCSGGWPGGPKPSGDVGTRGAPERVYADDLPGHALTVRHDIRTGLRRLIDVASVIESPSDALDLSVRPPPPYPPRRSA